MLALNFAPSIEQEKNIFEGLNLSVIAAMAKTRVPRIKPACTLEVILTKLLASKPNSEMSSGKMVFPANHRDVDANCETIITSRMCFDFTVKVR